MTAETIKPTDLTFAINLINAHKGTDAAPQGTSWEAYVGELEAANARLSVIDSVDILDRRLASQMAVDMSKTLVQIALAGIAAFIAFSQISDYPALWSGRFWAMAMVVIFFALSILAGAYVVSGIWQRGEGRKALGKSLRWSTEPARRALNVQAGTGALAVCFFLGVVFLTHEPRWTQDFRIGLPGEEEVTTSGEIAISGQWQTLLIVSKRTHNTFQIPASKPGQSDVITIAPK
jgi:hypothetical protein